MPSIKLYGEKWKYTIGKSAVVVTSPDGEEFVASHNELTCDFTERKRKGHNQCIVRKEDIRRYIEYELM